MTLSVADAATMLGVTEDRIKEMIVEEGVEFTAENVKGYLRRLYQRAHEVNPDSGLDLNSDPYYY